MSEHAFLVALSFEGDDRAEAQKKLARYLDIAGSETETLSCQPVSSWVAEDDRFDGSDCDSAVFVTPGRQHEASQALVHLGLTGTCNVADRETEFTGEPIGGSEQSPTHVLADIATIAVAIARLRAAADDLDSAPRVVARDVADMLKGVIA